MKNPMINFKEIIADTASAHYNVRDELKENTVAQNIEICQASQLPFSVGVINVAGELNVGMMLRSAMLLGAENFYIFGRKKFDKRSTLGAEKYLNVVQYVSDPLVSEDDIVLELSLLPNTIVLCELGGYELGADNSAFYARFNKPPLFLFGSESHGISSHIMNQFPSAIVSIPQRGVLRSFNVSASMNIICWDYLKEMHL
jgi:tRNA(Leu) C34 or U34 (ribose-2'-O)-methylase TrmL